MDNAAQHGSAVAAAIKANAGTCLTVAVLGASGDLARKKTYPALHKLFEKGFLPKHSLIVGYARSPMSDDQLRSQLRGYLKGSEKTKDDFLRLCVYIPGQYSLTCDTEGPVAFQHLADALEAHEAECPSLPGNRLFYLALPPSTYPPVCENIKKCCISQSGWTRVVVEKPFGRDLKSSEALNEQICCLFDEKQLYRIDHYLGKEIVQNLMVMRFANRFLSPLWNRENIANVQIIFKEPFGVEGRGGYFDHYGIIRDVIQNHLLQIMALIAMERPPSLSPDDIRDEKLKVLRCVPPLSTDKVVLGQYTTGPNGEAGYLDDPTVPTGSSCPTFALCVLYVNNERWDGVPFILKAGKGLNEHKTEIRVQMKDVPGDLFSNPNANMGSQTRNEFVLRVQPDPAIYMKMTVKDPGMRLAITQGELELAYNMKYDDVVIPDAYERLILDCINGDQQHFVRRDELKASWSIFTPLLHYIDAGGYELEPYVYGSRGPYSADRLREAVGHITNIVKRDVTWGMAGVGEDPYAHQTLSP
mmetsp:Transcript_10290/g.19471  ORF Transcript_10290/g.19471 Transcript_10290/m.19471 type:complete len:529 (-) Transcript_10290:118-1704(-)